MNKHGFRARRAAMTAVLIAALAMTLAGCAWLKGPAKNNDAAMTGYQPKPGDWCQYSVHGNLQLKILVLETNDNDVFLAREFAAGGNVLRSEQARVPLAALRGFEIWACNADDGDDCSAPAGFSLAYASPANAFPGDPPRPVAPQMILRQFDIPDTQATHLRLVVKTNQCTGGPEFQGEQDADPASLTDCDSNVPVGSSRSFVRAAELQAFSALSRAD